MGKLGDRCKEKAPGEGEHRDGIDDFTRQAMPKIEDKPPAEERSAKSPQEKTDYVF